MRTLFAVAGLLAALNWSVASAGKFLVTLQGASEPVGLLAWGLVLLVVAGGIKKRHSGRRRLSQIGNAHGDGLPNLLPRLRTLETSERGLQ